MHIIWPIARSNMHIKVQVTRFKHILSPLVSHQIWHHNYVSKFRHLMTLLNHKLNRKVRNTCLGVPEYQVVDAFEGKFHSIHISPILICQSLSFP